MPRTSSNLSLNLQVSSFSYSPMQKNSPFTKFYKEQATRAARSGATYDIIPISTTNDSFFGLSSLKFLSVFTSGQMFYYQRSKWGASLLDLPLPQDLYKFFSGPLGWGASMKLRTTEYLEIHNCPTNHLLEDFKLENLYHMSGIDPWKTYTFEIKINPACELPAYGVKPSVQVKLYFHFSKLC